LADVPEVMYRIEVETQHLGMPVAIRLVEVNDLGNIANSYVIPRSRSVAASQADDVSVRPLRRRKPPVVPPRADAKSKKDEERKEQERQQKPDEGTA